MPATEPPDHTPNPAGRAQRPRHADAPATGVDRPGVPVAIAMGANLGDPLAQLRAACRILAGELEGFQISPPFRSTPMYRDDQPDFMNAVALGRTRLDPRSLIARLSAIERGLGRRPGPRNGPRALDLDLLKYGSLIYRFTPPNAVVPAIQIPHPRLKERRFVLEPWLILDPRAQVPGVGRLADRMSDPGVARQRLEQLDADLHLPRYA